MAAQLVGAGVRPADRVVLVADNSADPPRRGLRGGGPRRARDHLPVVDGGGAGLRHRARRAGGRRPARGWRNGPPRPVGRWLDGTGALAGLPGGPVAGGPVAAGPVAGVAAGGGSGPALIDPDALALICFTSGSTARPKAVMHRHAGLLGAAAAYARVWHLGPDDATLVCLPMAWAFGLVTTSMAALLAGGRVVALARAEPEAMLGAMADHGVTFFAGVTTMFGKLVQHLDTRDGPRPDLSLLRLCISGGEPRNEAAFSRWQQLTGCPVHDVYAASECFPVVTYDPFEDPQPRPGQRRPGRA